MTNKELVLGVLKMAGYESPVEKQANGIEYHKDRWGYVLGGQGELYTEELAKKWAGVKRSGKTSAYFLTSAKQWYNAAQTHRRLLRYDRTGDADKKS